MLKPVRIGDRVVIGADSIIGPGAEISNGSVLQIRSVVYPDTLIPPSEYRGGHPAQKIKDLMPRQIGAGYPHQPSLRRQSSAARTGSCASAEGARTFSAA